MRVRPLLFFVSLLALLTAISSASTISRRPVTDQPRASASSWFRPPPPASSGKWTQLDPARLYLVDPIMLLKAQALLARTPIAKLTMEQAKRLVGNRLMPQAGRTPYLVRALYYGDELNLVYGEGARHFEAYTLNRMLLIDHFSLGPRSNPMRRHALVLFLKDRPQQVYVTCGGAE